MGKRCKFVQPEVVRLPLSDDEWIDIKRELNAGETRRIYTDLITDFRAGEQAKLDPRAVGLTKMLNYIVGWSFCDAQDRPVPFSQAALENLEPGTYKEVNEAVEKHDQAVEKAREERKNGKAGESASSPTSPSVAG